MKKFLSSLAILATVLGMTSMSMAKTFKDVENTKYEEAVNVLTELKIVNGYEDNTYKPGNSVKRSELAKLLIVAMGKDKSASMLVGSTNFSDVSEKHWASGYINLASSLGIINGYPDGTFRPEAKVSYVEAAKMMLMALNYDKELTGLSWPTGYMSKANSAGLLKDVTAGSSSDSATRGNVATMVLNTLKGNTRKVVSSNSAGNNYGDGDILIEKAFEDLVYVEEGKVSDINVKDEIITVKDEVNDRTVKITYTDTSNMKKLFGREVSFIYDEENEKLLSFKTLDSVTVKTVDVSEIDEEEYIIIDDDSKEYDLPRSSNILMIGATRYADVNKAYITLDKNNKVTYVVLEGVEKIYAGLVYDSSITIDGKRGIEVLNTDNRYVDLPLANTSATIYANDVILYAYNNENKIVIKTLEDVEDALQIDSVDSKSIKLKDKEKLTFSSTSQYQVVMVGDDIIKLGKLSNIDASYDLATTIKIGDVWYILIFDDTTDKEEIAANQTFANAKKALNDALKKAKNKKEKDYSVVTYERLRDAIEYGQRIYSAASSYSTAMIQLATQEINDAIAALKNDTAADRTLRTDFANLQKKIAEIEALDKDDYTADSWKKLADVLTSAKAIVIERTDSPKVTTAINNLTSAKNLLVTNTSAQQVKEAIDKLNKAISSAKSKTSSDYESKSFAELKQCLSAAEAIGTKDSSGKIVSTNAGVSELRTVTNNLDAALSALIPANFEEYKNQRKALEDYLASAKEKLDAEEEYTTESFTAFKTAYEDVNGEYKNLKSSDDVKAMTNANVKKEIDDVIKPLNTKIQTAIKGLIVKPEFIAKNNAIKNLKAYVDKFDQAYNTEDAWKQTGSVLSYTEIKAKITTAKDALKDTEITTDELKDLADDLSSYIQLN